MLLFWSQFLILCLELTCLSASKGSRIISFLKRVRSSRWRADQPPGVIFLRSNVKCHSTNDDRDLSLTEGPINLRIVDEKDTSSKGSLLKDICAVAVPALAACIVEPALSLVDTYYVGKVAATATMGLAGMSINGALFNIIAAATAPIGTGTTAVISRIRGLGEKTDKKDRAGSSNLVDNSNNHEILGSGSGSSVGEVFLSGIFLAAGGGAILTALCILFGNSFVREVFQIKDGLLAVTVKYLKIRGLSLPSVLLNYIVFGFSIAMQDSVAPVLSIVTAFLVNVLGDYVLVGRLGYGLSGAAVATTVSSYLGSMVALRHLFKRYDIRIPRNVRSSAAGAGAANISGPIAWGKILNRRGLAMFFTASGPLLAGAMVNTLTYSAGARISSFTVNPALSTIEVAAHQVVMQSWWFLSYFSSPLSLVAQAVIPKDLVKGDSRRAQRMVVLLLQLAGVVAAVVTVLNVLLITRFPGIFTKNSEIQQIVRRVLVPSSVSLFVICMTTAADGIFIGCGRVRDFLNASVISTTAAWVCFAYSIWNRMGLSGAWNGLLTFSVFRMLYYLVTFKSLWSSVSKHRPQTSDRDR